MVAATNGNFNVVNDPVYRQCIAAALRAAVRRLSYGGALSDVDAGFVIDECALLAIADELDPPLET
jgi:hypothetical protein